LVISIGNITAGGTGKTPLSTEIAKKLSASKKNVAVASSLIRSETRDEICMMERNLPGVVFTGKTTREIEELAGKTDAVILDDGFHCRYLYKDVNLLVLDASNPFDNNLLIPSGLLREPKRFIKQADVFILTHTYMVGLKDTEKILSYLKTFNKPVFIMDYEIKGLKNRYGEIEPDVIHNKEIISFAGIGNPLNFFYLILGLEPRKVEGVIYPDHFHYKERDMNEICYLYLKKEPDYIVTTEKDYIKIKDRHPKDLPLFYLEITPVIRSVEDRKKDFDILLTEMLE
jgi:tetraacyldisaccharide 4'-kinase